MRWFCAGERYCGARLHFRFEAFSIATVPLSTVFGAGEEPSANRFYNDGERVCNSDPLRLLGYIEDMQSCLKNNSVIT